MITASSRRGACCTTRPLPSIHAEMPVFAAINSGLRHSTARNTPHFKCKSNSLEPQNQPSLVTFTSTSGSAPCSLSARTCSADQMRNRRFVADVRAIANAVDLLADRLCRRPSGRRKAASAVEKRKTVRQRHVFAEHDRMHLVVGRQQRSVGGDELGAVVMIDPAVGMPMHAIDAEQQRRVAIRGRCRRADSSCRQSFLVCCASRPAFENRRRTTAADSETSFPAKRSNPAAVVGSSAAAS